MIFFLEKKTIRNSTQMSYTIYMSILLSDPLFTKKQILSYIFIGNYHQYASLSPVFVTTRQVVQTI